MSKEALRRSSAELNGPIELSGDKIRDAQDNTGDDKLGIWDGTLCHTVNPYGTLLLDDELNVKNRVHYGEPLDIRLSDLIS